MANTDPTGYLSIPLELIRGAAWKRPVRAASTGNLTLSGTQTIDGVACVAGDRVLAKNQTSGSQNGIYVVASGAWTRAFDMDQDLTTAVPAEESLGAMVVVLEGTTNGGALWRCTNTGTVTLGTTALTFAQFGSGASFATPAIVLGTAAAAGAASTTIRSDATILAFDAIAPANIPAPGVASSAGSQAVAARRDHGHALTYHDEPLTDGASNFIFAAGDIVVVTGVPN